MPEVIDYPFANLIHIYVNLVIRYVKRDFTSRIKHMTDKRENLFSGEGCVSRKLHRVKIK